MSRCRERLQEGLPDAGGSLFFIEWRRRLRVGVDFKEVVEIRPTNRSGFLSRRLLGRITCGRVEVDADTACGSASAYDSRDTLEQLAPFPESLCNLVL